MFKTVPNERTVTVKLTRHELIDLMLLCAVHMDEAEKWKFLNQNLYEQLKNHDAKHLDDKEV